MDTLTHAFTGGRGRTTGAALIALLVACAAASCSKRFDEPGSGSGSGSGSGPSPVTQLSIEGPAVVALGSTATFKALLRDTAGQVIRDVTADVQWITSDPTVLWVHGGLARGLAPGLASVEVRLVRQKSSLDVAVDAVSDPGALPASLTIERLSASVFGPDPQGNFWYEPRFLLTETSGDSGATILDIMVVGPTGSDRTGPACWWDRLRVPAGGTLDTFYTDDGLEWLAYCAPGTGGLASSSQLRVIVSYIGDGGQFRNVEAVVNAVK